MARGPGTYSRVISLLKVLLPLVALALLSTMFLLARRPDPGTSLPIADTDLRNRAESEQVTAPYFTGTADNGAQITLSANNARPDPARENGIVAEDVAIRIKDPGRAEARITAPRVLLDQAQQSLRMEGGIRLETNDGYTVVTGALSGTFNPVSAVSDGEVEADGPAGTFRAGTVRVFSDPETGDLQLNFTGGVKLIYDPRSQTE